MNNVEEKSKENSMERHRRYIEQAGEIVSYAKAHGILEAMDRFDIRNPATVRKLINRKDRNVPKNIISKRALFDSNEGYFEGVFRAILRHIQTMEDHTAKLQGELAEKDALIASKEAEINRLKASPRFDVEDSLFTELLNKIDTSSQD